MELTGLLRARVLLVMATLSMLGVVAGDVFDRRVWWLLIPPLLVGATAVVTITRRWSWRVLLLTVATAASTAIVVGAVGGEVSDFVDVFGSGARQILSTDWPSPYRPALVGVVAAGLAIATAVGAELARQRRFHLAPLIPMVVATTMVIALSAPLGVRLVRLAPIAGLAVVLAALRPGDGTGLRERLMLLRGERRLVVVAAIVVALATAASVPVAFTGRDDPRRNDPADRAATVLDPIEATLALQDIDPPIDLHDIEITARGGGLDGRQPLRWRTAALSDYDGRRWSPELTLRPIGRRLDQASDDTITASVRFLDPNLQLVPIPGSPVVVDAEIETDPQRTIVRLIERPNPGTEVELIARVAPTVGASDPGLVGIRPVSDRAGGFTDLAEGIAEEGGSDQSADLVARLTAIESVLRNDFVLRSDASGGGLQQSLIDRFLRDTRRGNAEQFATSFVILARSLGADARVATGFLIDTELTSSSTFVLTSEDAQVWPEVRIADRWVAFDPVPENEASDAAPEEPEPQRQTPAAPQPPVIPPPESADEPDITDDDDEAADDDALPAAARYALVAAGVGAAAAVPVLLLILLVLGIKWRRRRQLLRGDPGDRIRGAWKLATSRLIDGGLIVGSSSTNDEIATAGSVSVPAAQRELNRLARLSDAATFGSPVREDLLAADAASCLGQVETSMAQSRGWFERLRWRLSLRSLRRSTASPV